MALSTPLTRLQLRTIVRRELMDSNSRWWTDTELNTYLDDWHNQIQTDLELVWATTTTVTSTATHTLTALSTSILRPDAAYWNGIRLVTRTPQDLDTWRQNWREEGEGTPYVVYQPDSERIVLWPAPSTSGTLTLEYPLKLSQSDDLTPTRLPGWVRYSAIAYACYRAYLRNGPNHSIERALRRKAQFNKLLNRYRLIVAQFFPDKYLTLSPGGQYEARILNPRPAGGSAMPTVISLRHNDEVPSGVVDGTNFTFTLSQTPDPAISLKVYVDGVLMTKDTHYSLSDATISFSTDYIPVTGQTLFATYRYTN